MEPKDYYKVGFILKPHGLKGEVTIAFDADFPEETPGSIFIGIGSQVVPYFIESLSRKGEKGYLKLEDVRSLEDAGKISGSGLFLPKSSRPRSGRGEFYDDEVIGFSILDTQTGPLGTVTGILAAGSNRLLAVEHGEKEVLIPLNSPFIKGVNKSKKLITVELPEGFLDL
jgi:16S rRNA processing protein RimM